jgi:VCBS repeat-containing protein
LKRTRVDALSRCAEAAEAAPIFCQAAPSQYCHSPAALEPLLTVHSDGTFAYDPNHAFDATPTAGSGASNTPAHDSFTYTLTGGGTATVSIAIDGLDSNDLLLGTAGADVLSGGIGNDRLDGLAGADQMTGGSGDDLYIVDNAGDVVNETPGGGNDTVQTSVSYVLAAGTEIETLTVDDVHGTGPIDLTGNAFGQTIIGNDASNGLNGMGGTDLFHGGGGNDYYVVDSADDQVFENGGEGYDIVFATVSYALQAGQEVESLGAYDQASTLALDLTGNEFDNRIVGNAGSNGLNGMGGADQMFGLGGNDFYVVDNAGDQVFELPGDGYDIVFATVSYTLGTGQEIESLGAYDQSGTAAISLSGNEFDNRIVGNAGDNVLDGSLGSDVLFGLGGADTFAFTTAPSAANVDFLGDFTSGTDQIALDHNVFSALGVGSLDAGAFVIGSDAQDANTRIIYNSAIGSLLYDPDGTGAAAAIQFATVQPGTVITASDFHVI